MADLPKTIQVYLEDAGVTATEIHILKHLLVGEEYTVRELALNLKKSTGVINSSCEKLLDRGFIKWNKINQTSKIGLISPDVIQKWMKQDMDKKRETLLRREKDFDAYIQSIQIEHSRPDMHHYEGVEGFEQAYRKLLESGEEMLHYMPIACKEEEDVMYEFRKLFSQERKAKGVSSRIITHDTSLGRRFKDRDAHESRETLLVSDDEWPIEYEKVICGNQIAFFNHQDLTGYVLKSAKHAKSEKQGFDVMWKMAGALARGEMRLEEKVEEPFVMKLSKAMKEFLSNKKNVTLIGFIVVNAGLYVALNQFLPIAWQLSIWDSIFASLIFLVALITGMFFNGFRGLGKQFFSKLLTFRSILTILVCLGIAASITFGIYLHTKKVIQEDIGNRLMAIAATAAPEIDVSDLEPLRTARDMKKPEYQRVYEKLNEIRDNNKDVLYVYIFRDSTNNMVEFVADADSNHMLIDDENHEIEVIPPGVQYDRSQFTKHYDKNLFVSPVVETDIVVDVWGSYISAAAPIRSEDGEVMAALGLDLDVSDFISDVNNRFSIFVTFLWIILVQYLIAIFIVLSLRRD